MNPQTLDDIPCTDAQRLAAERIIKRYEQEPVEVCFGFGDIVFLIFPFITIGIEPDGYAHS